MGQFAANPLPGEEPLFQPTDDYGWIDVENIGLGERLRPVDELWADIIGRAMLVEGQATPIVVCRLPGDEKFTLVAGAHRLVGARMHGIPQLKAELINSMSQARAQIEVSENLWRQELSPIDRAVFIAKQVELVKLKIGVDPTKDGRAASAKARGKDEKPETGYRAEATDQTTRLSFAYGWSDEVAADLGIDKRTVERNVRIYRMLPPSLIETLRAVRHPVLRSQAELLKLTKAMQHSQKMAFAVVDALLGDATLSVGAARKKVEGADKAPPDPSEKHINAFTGSYTRLSVTQRQSAFHLLVCEIKSIAELKKMRAMIEARLEELA